MFGPESGMKVTSDLPHGERGNKPPRDSDGLVASRDRSEGGAAHHKTANERVLHSVLRLREVAQDTSLSNQIGRNMKAVQSLKVVLYEELSSALYL